MTTQSRKFWPPPEKETPSRQTRPCDHPGCSHGGEYRAPRSRVHLNEYYWFCLDHVRLYNQSWDYYAGCSIDEIEQSMREDTTWQRQTWPMGGANRRFSRAHARVQEAFEQAFADDEAASSSRARAARARYDAPTLAAMRLMGLVPPLSVEAVRTQYKDLCKRYHPDANGGDKQAEEMFKQLGLAYHVLMAALAS